MTHYISGLISRAGTLTGPERTAAQRECFEAILALWQHRSKLPNGSRPFEDLEPVFRAIESLDPESDMPRYYPSARPGTGEAVETSEQEKWLALADGLDRAARMLIGYFLTSASRGAIDKSAEWVKAAEALNAGDSVPEIIIRSISTRSDLQKKTNPNDRERKILTERMRKLNAFVELARSLTNDLQEHLDSLPAASNTDDNSDYPESE